MSANTTMSKNAKRRQAKKTAQAEASRLLEALCLATTKPQAQKPKATKKKRKAAKAAPTGRMERGTDVIATVNVLTSTLVGQGLMRFIINPRSIDGTRIQRMSQLWARWTPTSLRLEVVSTASLMVSGGYIVAWDADPQTDFSARADAVTRLTSMVHSVQATVGQRSVLQIPSSTSRKWYTVTGDANDDSHGVVLLACAGKVSADTTLTVKLHWSIRFEGPDLPPTLEEDVMTWPDSEYVPCFTDAVSDWASGTKLTFKHHEGGSVVPWENVHAGYIYVPTAGVNIPYYKQDGTQGKVEYLAKIIDSPLYSSALACFGSLAAAQNYVKKGLPSYALNYYKAGELVTPKVPHLKGNVASTALLVGGPSKPLQINRGAVAADDFSEDVVERIAQRVLQLLNRSLGPSTSQSGN